MKGVFVGMEKNTYDQSILRTGNCGNRNKDTMNVTRRTCGYIGTNFWNQGRTEEIKERYVHVDDHESEV